MKGTRYVIEVNNTIKIIGLQEYTRTINKGVDIKLLGTLNHLRKKIKEPATKKRILDLFKSNIDYIANKGKRNCYMNFKKLIINQL